MDAARKRVIEETFMAMDCVESAELATGRNLLLGVDFAGCPVIKVDYEGPDSAYFRLSGLILDDPEPAELARLYSAAVAQRREMMRQG